MTQGLSETPTPTLVRVTVVAGERRADLALPGAVPVAELLPELVRTLGVLDASTVHGGYWLVTPEGRRLSGETGLTFQGVGDGGVLTVAAGVDQKPPRVYDDIVEAMADVVESDLRPWQPSSGRRTALGAAALLLTLGATALGLQRVSLVAAAAAGVVAVLLTVAAVVLARLRGEPESALVLTWTAVAYGIAAGLAGVPGESLLGLPALVAGAAVLLVGVTGTAGLVEHRAWLLPAVAAGAVIALCGGVVALTDLGAAQVYVVALALAVVAGSLVPWFALGSTSTAVRAAHNHADLTAEPDPIRIDDVRRDARGGHELLLGGTTALGVLLVLVAPLAVSLGVSGALVAVCAGVVLLLRTRQYRVATEVLAGLLGGVAGLAATAVAVLVLQPDWRPVLAVVLAAVATALLCFTVLPVPPSVRRGRAGDVAEGMALVALLPLLVVAIGLVAALRT